MIVYIFGSSRTRSMCRTPWCITLLCGTTLAREITTVVRLSERARSILPQTIMSKTWEDLLFRKHHLVAFSPLSRLECFDVFMQKGKYGVVHRGPIVSRVGSLVSLASGDNTDWPTWKPKIETKSHEAFTCSGGQLEEVGTFQETVKPSKQFLARLGLDQWASANVELSGAHSLICKAVGVAKATVKPDFIENLVNGSPPRWTPDTGRKELKWPTDRNGKDTTLWVVTEVLYAQKVIVGQNTNVSFGAKVQTVIPGVGSDLGDFKISKDNQGSWVVTAASGSRVPFAFKATKLVYNNAGQLADIDAYVKKRPRAERRGHDDDGKKAFDPERDAIFHMRELFHPGPGPQGSEDNDIDLECLVEFLEDESEEE